MAELLVLFACLNNTGCSETSSQYYSQHPEFQEFVKTQENNIKQAVGPIITQYGFPIMYAAAGKEATIRLSKTFYFTGSIQKQAVLFKYEF
jgi:hypothetical protein